MANYLVAQMEYLIETQNTLNIRAIRDVTPCIVIDCW